MKEPNISYTDPDSIPAFNVMAKPAGPICNLDCQYCFYLEKEQLYPGTKNFEMPYSILESFIRQYIEAQKDSQVHFAWQGGEPTLLGVEYFKRVIEIQKRYSNGKSISNAFQTNGILLDDEWCEFFAENAFLVGVSVDGPKELHDKYRVNKAGAPTFDQVMRGIGYLKKHKVSFNTLTVVQRDNSYKPLDVYNFLKEVGSGFMQFIPVVEKTPKRSKGSRLHPVGSNLGEPGLVSEWSVEPLQYGNFLCAIFDEWVRKDVGRFFVQIFDVSLESWSGLPQSLCVFRKTCGDAMIVEHNGDVYSCDHFAYVENRLGNLAETALRSLVDSDQQRKFGNDKLDLLPRYCRTCEVGFACNGECPKHRFIKTPDGEEGLNYLCAGYKKFFSHINLYMKFMANELRNQRPPANVMQWALEKDRGFPSLKPARNEACPCGIGLKYKKCCGNKA